MIVAGIGARKKVTADEVLAVLDAALVTHGLPRAAISALVSSRAKSAEPAIAEAASQLGIACQGLSDELLRSSDSETLTRSDASIAATGFASLSEAAALAAAGPGGSLLGPRVALGSVTCALARTGGAS